MTANDENRFTCSENCIYAEPLFKLWSGTRVIWRTHVNANLFSLKCNRNRIEMNFAEWNFKFSNISGKRKNWEFAVDFYTMTWLFPIIFYFCHFAIHHRDLLVKFPLDIWLYDGCGKIHYVRISHVEFKF